MACTVKVITGNRDCLTNDFRHPAGIIAHMFNCGGMSAAIVSRIGFPLSSVSSCASSSLCSSIKSANGTKPASLSGAPARPRTFVKSHASCNDSFTEYLRDQLQKRRQSVSPVCWVRCVKCFYRSAFNKGSIHI